MSKEKQAQVLDAALRQTYHEADANIYVHTYQDVEPAMDYAARRRRADAEERGRFGKHKDLHMTMSLPFNIILAAAQRLNIPAGQIFASGNMKKIVKELKRPEFKVFRTTIDKNI